MEKSDYISRPTAQKITGCDKETLIDLLEREVIEAYRKPDKSWAILRASAEEYARVNKVKASNLQTNNEGKEEVSFKTAMKYIECDKDDLLKLIEDDVIKAYRDERRCWKINKNSLAEFLKKN